MSTNETTTRHDLLLEDFERELIHAHTLGVEDGTSTTDYRTASRFAECFKSNTPAQYLPALPEDAQGQLKEMIKDGELADDGEVINQYLVGFAEGCAKAIERMQEARIQKTALAGE